MKKKRAAAGTDVAKEFSKVCIMTPDMQVFKTLHVTHNKLEDFEKLFVLLDQVKRSQHFSGQFAKPLPTYASAATVSGTEPD